MRALWKYVGVNEGPDDELLCTPLLIGKVVKMNAATFNYGTLQSMGWCVRERCWHVAMLFEKVGGSNIAEISPPSVPTLVQDSGAETTLDRTKSETRTFH